MNGEHSQTTLKRGKPVKGYPTHQSNIKWEEKVAEGVLVCKNKYTHAERTSTPMLKEQAHPCWKNKHTHAERTSWKNKYTHAERTSTHMLKEQGHPCWKNKYTHAERTSTPMMKEHDNYNSEWLLQTVNLFAKQEKPFLFNLKSWKCLRASQPSNH